MTTDISLENRILDTEALFNALKREPTTSDRLRLLKGYSAVKIALYGLPQLKRVIFKLKEEEQEILLSLIALGQGHAVFTGWDKIEDAAFALKHLADSLKPLIRHYHSLGGLVGYQLIALKLISRKKRTKVNQTVLKPEGISLQTDSQQPLIDKYIRAGIEMMPLLGEVYPVGGAADRFNLRDEITGEALPQARLIFEGRTLLEGIFRDLAGREYLYEKITGEKIITPVALMTSPEKQNTLHIQEILTTNNWFGRPKELVLLFEQPVVPLISEEGLFATKGILELDMKPGGHGVIWSLMETYGVFKWFKSLKRKKIILRQINNPLAGTNANLLSLFGKGISEKRAFGFLSCPRRVGAPEGMNVVLTSKNEDGYATCLTNIEYTDFKARGIDDTSHPSDYISEAAGTLTSSQYPANTNILFADLDQVKKALKNLPLPGMLINLKTPVEVFSEEGKRKKSLGGRLESTMQNIADVLVNYTITSPSTKDIAKLKSFILLNSRDHTLSPTKKDDSGDENFEDTPTGAWFSRQKNARELFSKLLNFTMPKLTDPFKPSFDIDFHPALGPLWSIIAQKIKNGLLKSGSELKLEVSEVLIEDFNLKGSFKIYSDTLQGRVLLKNVEIINKGLDFEKSRPLWKGKLCHKEKFEITLLGQSEFEAENIVFEGSHHFEVPDGYKMTVFNVKGKIKTTLKKINTPSWYWLYSFKDNNSVLLTFKK